MSGTQMEAERAAPALRVVVSDSVGRLLGAGATGLWIGSDPACELILDGSDVAPRHLRLERLWRAWLLRVQTGAAHVHVNARAVRELALVRLGDVISVGDHKLLLLPTDEDAVARTHVRATATVPRPGLRCVAGPLSGRYLAGDSGWLLDASLLRDARGALRLQHTDAGMGFELLGEEGVLPARNGVIAAHGELRDGDQLTWGRHRFVLEDRRGPGRVAPPPVVAPAAAPPPEPSTRHEIAWLLGVALLLALAIAAALLLRP